MTDITPQVGAKIENAGGNGGGKPTMESVRRDITSLVSKREQTQQDRFSSEDRSKLAQIRSDASEVFRQFFTDIDASTEGGKGNLRDILKLTHPSYAQPGQEDVLEGELLKYVALHETEKNVRNLQSRSSSDHDVQLAQKAYEENKKGFGEEDPYQTLQEQFVAKLGDIFELELATQGLNPEYHNRDQRGVPQQTPSILDYSVVSRFFPRERVDLSSQAAVEDTSEVNQEVFERAVADLKGGKDIYSFLSEANQETKRAITREWIRLMRGAPQEDLDSMDVSEGDLARQSFYRTWRSLYLDTKPSSSKQSSSADYSIQRGFTAWDPEKSAALVERGARTSGFLQAITSATQEAAARGESVQTACDVGTGSTALLALTLAANGVGKVDAYELDHEAAQVAQNWVNVLGFGENIKIAQGDVTKMDLPQYDLAVSETFHAGLTDENGAKIMRYLSDRAKRTIPDSVKILAIDHRPNPVKAGPELADEGWLDAGIVRFADLEPGEDEDGIPKMRVRGKFSSKGNEKGAINVCVVTIPCSNGKEMIPLGADALTDVIYLGSGSVSTDPNKSETIEISWVPGMWEDIPRKGLWYPRDPEGALPVTITTAGV